MPFPWLLLHSASLQKVKDQVAPKSQIQTFGDVTVTYGKGNYEIDSDTWTFNDGVILKYQDSTIYADHMLVQQGAKHASATGHVHVDDPTAMVDSDNVELWWDPADRHGVVRKGVVRIGSARIRADLVEIHPKLWEITQAQGTTSRANPPWYQVRSPKVTLIPGRNGKIKKPTLYLLGKKIATFPDRTFELDKKTEGLGLPGVNLKSGLGVSWSGGILIDHSTDFSFGFGVYPNVLPSYLANVSHSLLGDSPSNTILTPASDLSERFSFGYFDNVYTSSPIYEDHYMRYLKRTISFDSAWNVEASDRDLGTNYSKAGEIIYEQGSALGKFGYLTQARFQIIREGNTNFESRAELVGDFALPSVHLTKNIYTLSRLDSDVFVGPNQYGWVRASSGLAYEPFKQLRLSVGGFASKDAGNPDFPIDRLVGTLGMTYRIDLNLGPTKISVLTKYDTNQKWYDHEFSVSQVIGCLELFLLRRELPETYVLGLRLNLSDLTDLMTKRNFDRPPSTPKVISPQPDGHP